MKNYILCLETSSTNCSVSISNENKIGSKKSTRNVNKTSSGSRKRQILFDKNQELELKKAKRSYSPFYITWDYLCDACKEIDLNDLKSVVTLEAMSGSILISNYITF